jgi:hypothetical protein
MRPACRRRPHHCSGFGSSLIRRRCLIQGGFVGENAPLSWFAVPRSERGGCEEFCDALEDGSVNFALNE